MTDRIHSCRDAKRATGTTSTEHLNMNAPKDQWANGQRGLTEDVETSTLCECEWIIPRIQVLGAFAWHGARQARTDGALSTDGSADHRASSLSPSIKTPRMVALKPPFPTGGSKLASGRDPTRWQPSTGAARVHLLTSWPPAIVHRSPRWRSDPPAPPKHPRHSRECSLLPRCD